GSLEVQAVGQRIGERHAQRDHAATRLLHLAGQLDRALERGVPCGDEADEALAPLLAQPPEPLTDAAHQPLCVLGPPCAFSVPSASSSIPRSLSPRPLALISTRWPASD